jgi:hypothetical protein
VIKNWSHSWKQLLSNNDIVGYLKALLEDMDAQQWFGITLVQDWPKTNKTGARMMQDVTMTHPTWNYCNNDVGLVG